MTAAIRLAAASARANYRRFALSAVAIALSVAFVTATLILGSSVAGTAAQDTAAANAGIDAVVTGRLLAADDGPDGEIAVRESLSPQAVAAVAAVPGVANAVGVTEGFARVVADGGAVGTGIDSDVGRNWIADAALNPFALVAGAAPAASGEVVIDEALAAQAGLRVGDDVEILTATGVHRMTLTGTTNYGPAASAPLQRTVHFASEAAVEMLGADRLSQIVIRADPGIDLASLVKELGAVVPGSEAVDGAGYVARLQASVTSPFAFLALFLTAFAGTAAVVAATIIYNTISIALAQRRRELALMRAVGAQRSQVMWSVMVEAVLMGAAATAVGLVAGVLGVGLLRSLMDLLGASFLDGPTVVEPLRLAVSAAIGIAVTAASAWAPARRCAGAAPVEALREAAAESPATSRRRNLSGFALLTLGAAAMACAVMASSSLLLAGAVLFVPGLVLAGPALVVATASAGRFLLGRRRGVTGPVAAANLARNRRRAASTTLTLTLGVALIAFFTVLANSFTTSLTRDLDDRLRADYVAASLTSERATIDPALADSLDAIDGVDTVASLRVAWAAKDGVLVAVGGIDPAVFARVFDLGVTAGSLDELAAGGVAVLASDAPDVAVGDTVAIQFADQTGEFPVVATFANSLGGYDAPAYLASVETLDAYMSGLPDFAVYMSAADATAAAEVEAAVAASPGARFETKASYVAGTGTDIDQFRNLIWAMLSLTVVLALVGVANTTTLAMHQRVREIGTLRAIGATARGVRRIIRFEAGLLAALGTVVGLVLAVVGGWATLEVLAGAQFGAVVPWLSLAVIGVGAVAAGVLAAAYPAWRATRVPLLDALAVTG